MAALQLQHNMGITDRLIRGVAGSILLINGLRHIGNSGFRKVEATLGGALLANGLSGCDPMLSAFGASTIPGRENNVFHLIRQTFPGQGIRPVLTQNVLPRRTHKRFNERTTMAEALSIG